jgi:hypothetical protein
VVNDAGLNITGAGSGFGSVKARIAGPSGSSFTASGGALTLGDAGAADGFTSFSGSLVAGSNQVNLLSSGISNLGAATTLAGGTLASINGIQLNSTNTLTGYGTVQGKFVNQGAITGGSSSNVLHFAGAVNGAGSFAGNVQFDDIYSPGNSPANVTLAGNTTFSSSSQLRIELGGATVGTGYDHVNFGGNLALGGVLNVSLINSFQPVAGESFDIFDFTPANLSGTFSAISLPALPAGLMWNASQLYSTGALLVNLQGDYNGNGVVDAADYTVWRGTLGSTTNLTADGNQNGMIDSGDYDIWKSNFGSHAGSGASAHDAVPEPSTLTLLMVSAASCCLRRRRAA